MKGKRDESVSVATLDSHGPVEPPSHVHVSQVEWTVATSYPKELKQVCRWKTLMGAHVAAGQGVPQEEVDMGVLELDAGATYPAHAHPAPEIYYVVSGTAEWTVGKEMFMAEAGTAIYHPPNILHRMVNTGKKKLRAVYFW